MWDPPPDAPAVGALTINAGSLLGCLFGEDSSFHDSCSLALVGKGACRLPAGWDVPAVGS